MKKMKSSPGSPELNAIVCAFCDRLIEQGTRPVAFGICLSCAMNRARWLEWVRVAVTEIMT